MLPLLTAAVAGDDLVALYWLTFFSFEDLKTLSSVSRKVSQSPVRRTLGTRGVWRLPYPPQWQVPAASSDPPPATLPAFEWAVYELGTYLHGMDTTLKHHLQSVAVPRSAMLHAVASHLPGVTRIRTWHFDGEVAGIQQLTPYRRRRIYTQLREIDLRELAEHDITPSLTVLCLRNASLLNLHCISALRGLTTLNLSHTNITPQHSRFQWLASLTQLQSLNLDRTGLSDLAFLQSLPHLHTLSIANTTIASFADLAPVGSTLTSLDISNGWLESEHVDLTPLTHLRVLRAQLLGALNPLDLQLNAPQLASLSLRYCWLQHRDFLSQCPHLEALDLRDVIWFDEPLVPTAFPSLTRLQMSSNPVAIRSVDWSQASQLQTLHLWKWDPAFVDTDATDGAFQCDGSFLSNLPRLRALEIAKVSKFSTLPPTSPHVVSLSLHQFTASDLSALAQLLAANDRLERLCLSAEQAVQVDLPPLSAPATLRDLQLLNVTLTNLEVLALCVRLRSLEVSGFGSIPTAASLDLFVPQCLRLQSLTICQNSAFDDITSVTVLPALEVLSVRHTSVSCVAALAAMRSLQKLDLGYTSVTTVEALKGLERLQRIVLPAAVACALFHDADAFPLLRSVVHDHAEGANDCLLTGHDAIMAA